MTKWKRLVGRFWYHIRLLSWGLGMGVANHRVSINFQISLKKWKPIFLLRSWWRWIFDDDQFKFEFHYGCAKVTFVIMRPYLWNRDLDRYIVVYMAGENMIAYINDDKIVTYLSEPKILECGRSWCLHHAHDMAMSFVTYASVPGIVSIYANPVPQENADVKEIFNSGVAKKLIYAKYFGEGTYFHRGRIWRS